MFDTHLLLVLLPNLQHLLIWETNSIHSLQRIIISISKPCRRTMSGSSKSLNSSSVRNMRTSTKINKISALVYSGACSIRNLGLDDLLLEWVSSKELKSFFLRYNKTMELLLCLGDFLYFLLNWRICRFSKSKRMKGKQKNAQKTINTS